MGKFAIPLTSYILDRDLFADFSFSEETLYVYGDIDFGFFDRFSDEIKKHEGVTTVALGSAGGSVIDAIQVGLLIRRLGLDTVLAGPCLSACPLVFAGGNRRNIWMSSGPHLGFHQISSADGKPLELNHDIYLSILSYLDDMGIAPIPVLGWMQSTIPSEMFHPDLDDICYVNFATWVQRMCVN